LNSVDSLVSVPLPSEMLISADTGFKLDHRCWEILWDQFEVLHKTTKGKHHLIWTLCFCF